MAFGVEQNRTEHLISTIAIDVCRSNQRVLNAKPVFGMPERLSRYQVDCSQFALAVLNDRILITFAS